MKIDKYNLLVSKLNTRVLDGKSTQEIARAIGVSDGTALRYLKKLEAAGFQLENGASLVHSENTARKNGEAKTGSPMRYTWFFT